MGLRVVRPGDADEQHASRFARAEELRGPRRRGDWTKTAQLGHGELGRQRAVALEGAPLELCRKQQQHTRAEGRR